MLAQYSFSPANTIERGTAKNYVLAAPLINLGLIARTSRRETSGYGMKPPA